MGRFSTATIFAVLLTLLSGVTQAAERRIALVIGNGDYQVLRPVLANPTRDANAIGQALSAAGFETTVRTNVKRRELYQLIDAFGAQIAASPDTVGLFYYAGHGVQAGGKNYLIPVDAQLENDADLEAEAVEADKVLRVMNNARNAVNLVILDACRDNPLPAGRSLARGLATMDAPRGTFIGYAAAPGQSALDGEQGQNGVFTGALIKELAAPGIPIEEIFKRVIGDVEARTGGQQVPWMESSLQGDFYFAPPAASAPAAPAQTAAPGAVEKDVIYWESIKNSADPADYEDFIKRFPQSDFVSLAQRRLAALHAQPPAAAPPTNAIVPTPAVLAVAPPATAPPPHPASCAMSNDQVFQPIQQLYRAVNTKDIALYSAQLTDDATFHDMLTNSTRNKAEKLDDRSRQFAQWQGIRLTMEKISLAEKSATSATVLVTYSMAFRTQGQEFRGGASTTERYTLACGSAGRWLIQDDSDRINQQR